MMVNQRIFVVGCPRSGTTLLQSLLASHPEIHSFPETHFFDSAVSTGIRKQLGLLRPGAKEHVVNYLTRYGYERSLYLLPKYTFFLRKLTHGFFAIFDQDTVHRSKSHWVEKTPAHLHYVKEIQKYIPSAKLIHIVRNGPDTVASLYDVTKKYPKEWWGGRRSLERCIERWNSDMELTASYAAEKNHRVITYEALVHRPESVLKGLCEFIHIPFDKVILERGKEGAERIIPPDHPWVKEAGGPIASRNNTRFQTLLSEEEREYVNCRLLDNPFLSKESLE